MPIRSVRVSKRVQNEEKERLSDRKIPGNEASGTAEGPKARGNEGSKALLYQNFRNSLL